MSSSPLKSTSIHCIIQKTKKTEENDAKRYNMMLFLQRVDKM